MSIAEPSFTIGIEEEYLLVDLETRALAIEPSEDILSECERLLPDHLVTPEFLRSQLEVGTRVCKNITEARAALYELRRTVADVANQHGLGVMAASVHPFADWHQLKHTPKERYDVIARDMQATVRRLMICGMHVHCAIEDPELRIDPGSSTRWSKRVRWRMGRSSGGICARHRNSRHWKCGFAMFARWSRTA